MFPLYRMLTIFFLALASTSIFSQSNFWQPLNGPNGAKSIEAIASDDSSKLFISMGYKIFTSTDNGDSWNLCMAGINQSNFYYVKFLKSPSGAFYLHLSSEGLYRYLPVSNSWTAVSLPFDNYEIDGIAFDSQGRMWITTTTANFNIIHYSDDGGQTFQQIATIGQMLGWFDLIATHNDDHNLLAATYGFSENVYHFTKTGAVQEVISGSSPVRYVGYNPNSGTAFYSSYHDFKRSTDGGLTWQNITLIPGQSNQPSVSRMFFGTDGKAWAHTIDVIYYSENDGITWVKIPALQNYFTDFFRMENGDWFTTNDCGALNFSRSTDNGLTWTDLSTQFQYPIVNEIHKDGAGVLYTHTCQRNAYEKSNNEGQTWSDFVIEDGGTVSVNSLAVRPDGVMMAIGANEKPYRSLNNGSDWEEITNLSPLWGDSFWGAKFYVDYNGAFYLFEESGGVLKSTNNGDSWKSLNVWLDFQYYPPAFHPNGDIYLSDIFSGSVYVASADTVKSLEFDDQPFTPDISRAHCTRNGITFVSTSPINDNTFYRILPDGNYHPEPVPFFQGNYTISAITSNADGDVFVSNSSHVYKSEDDGLTWQIIAPIPDNNTYIPVLYVAPDQYLYAGLEGDVIHRSAQPTAEINRIFGKIWLDNDGDCQYDGGEQLRPSIAVTATGNGDYTSFSGYNGNFVLSAPSGTYALNVKAPNALYEACFSDVPVTLSGPNDSVFADLPMKAVAQCPYLRVSMSTPILRRCFDITYTIRYKNEGTAVAENAYVQVTLDSFFIFQNSTIPVATQNGFTYTFNVGDLAPGQSGSFNIVVTISCEASLGELHCVNAQIFPSDVCLPTLPPIAFYRECRENIGAFDPNDKRAFVDGNEEPGYVLPNTDIEYLIRFQNTGTDTAFRVVIEDRLSTLLDLASVTPLVSSHPYTMEVKDQRVLRFVFDNILLPDSNINEPASHGFIKLRVSQMPDVALGSFIRNEADIFFDFNAPVRTNQSSLIVGTVSTKPEPGNPYLVTAYPNPFNTTVTFEISGPTLPGTATLRLFDALGRQVRREEFAGEKFIVQRHELETGLYYFLIESDGKRIGAGKVMAH